MVETKSGRRLKLSKWFHPTPTSLGVRYSRHASWGGRRVAWSTKQPGLWAASRVFFNTYNESSPGDTLTTPGEAAWSIFQRDWQLTAQESGSGSVYTGHNFEVRQPPHWKTRQICMVKWSCEVLERQMELEGLDVLDLLGRSPMMQD